MANEKNDMTDHTDAMQARRAAITSKIQAETGIDEPMIERLVRGFYDRVRDDAALFARTAREICPQAAAERFIVLSHRIAESLELGIATSRGVMLRKGERYLREAET